MEYIESENYLCLATLIEIVLKDIGIRKYTRFDIAEELGITLPPSARGLVKGASYSEDEFQLGIKIDSEKMNSFFDRNEINLHAKYTQATPYTMLEEQISKWNQCYVIFLYSYGELVGNSELQDVGHAALFISMPNQQEVRIYDPGPKDSGEKNVCCYRLEEAMYQRRGGYILLQVV